MPVKASSLEYGACNDDEDLFQALQSPYSSPQVRKLVIRAFCLRRLKGEAMDLNLGTKKVGNTVEDSITNDVGTVMSVEIQYIHFLVVIRHGVLIGKIVGVEAEEFIESQPFLSSQFAYVKDGWYFSGPVCDDHVDVVPYLRSVMIFAELDYARSRAMYSPNHELELRREFGEEGKLLQVT